VGANENRAPVGNLLLLHEVIIPVRARRR
jgi:hypothetical protein